MSVREYIGARYITLFSDPIEWDSSNVYEPLTVVKYQGASYVSRQSVPEGIEISNKNYWFLWADYNAQIEQYRQDVREVERKIGVIDDIIPSANFDDSNTVKDYIDDAKALLPSTDFDSTNTVKAAIDDAKALLPSTDFDSTNTVKAAIDDVEDMIRTEAYFFGDSWGYGMAGGTWQPLVCEQLSLNRHNYCVEGSGYITAGTDGMTIPQKINSVTVENPNKVDLVVVCALTNDMGNPDATVSDLGTGVSNTCNLLKTKFPKAKILIVPNYRRYETMSSSNDKWLYITQTINSALASGVSVASDSINWLRTLPTAWNADNIHLVSEGYEFWGGCIVNCINGDNAMLSPASISSIASGWGQMSSMSAIQNGMVYLQLKFYKTTDMPVGTEEVATLSANTPKPLGDVIVPLIENNGKKLLGTAYIENGKIYLCNTSGATVGANREMFVEFIYPTSPYYRTW